MEERGGLEPTKLFLDVEAQAPIWNLKLLHRRIIVYLQTSQAGIRKDRTS